MPGLTDMAVNVNGSGAYWWYQRNLTLNESTCQVARLHVSRAMYGSHVYINGQNVGEFWPSYTPSSYDVRRYINFRGVNTFTIRVGEFSVLPKTVLSGQDFEKKTYIPGLFDSVSLVLCNNPLIDTVQTNPHLDGTLDVRIGLQNDGTQAYHGPVELTIKRLSDGRVVASANVIASVAASGTCEVDASLKIPNCRLWTPEDPFLYSLTTRTTGDERTDRCS